MSYHCRLRHHLDWSIFLSPFFLFGCMSHLMVLQSLVMQFSFYTAFHFMKCIAVTMLRYIADFFIFYFWFNVVCVIWEWYMQNVTTFFQPYDADFYQISPSRWLSVKRERKKIKINWCSFFFCFVKANAIKSMRKMNDECFYWRSSFFQTRLYAVALILIGFKYSSPWPFNQTKCIQYSMFLHISNNTTALNIATDLLEFD